MTGDGARPSGAVAAQSGPEALHATVELAETPLRLARRLSLAGKSCFAGTYVGGAAFALVASVNDGGAMIAALVVAVACVVVALGLLVASYALTLREAFRPATLTVADGGVALEAGGRRRVLARQRVRGCVRLARPRVGASPGEHVLLTLDTGDELLMRADGRVAAAIVDGLGFGVAGRAQTVDLASRTSRLWHVLIGYAVYQIVSLLAAPVSAVVQLAPAPPLLAMVRLAAVPVMFALYAAASRRLRPPRVTVGLDGVVVHAEGRATRLAWSEITAVDHEHALGPAALLTRRGRLPLFGRGVDLARRNAALELVRAGLARRGIDSEMARDFERRGRSAERWALDMATRAAAGHYRVAAVPDAAARVLESADASAEARVGAALALRGEPGAADRIRVVVDRVHDEELRARLASLAEELEPAHAQGESDDAPRRSR